MTNTQPRVVSRWVTAHGLRLHARVGAAPSPPHALPLVLVHGLTVSSRYMVPLAGALAPHHPVFAPDLPGFGRSDRPPRALSIPQLASALAAWMDATGIPEAGLLGQSMGCQIITELAVRAPHRARAILLVGPSMDRYARTILQQAWRLAVDGTRTPPSSIAIMVRDFIDCGPRRTLATLRHALADPIEDRFPRLTPPTLLIRGERDPVASQPWVEELAALLPDRRLAIVAGASHAAQYARPDLIARITRSFLAEVGADTRARMHDGAKR